MDKGTQRHTYRLKAYDFESNNTHEDPRYQYNVSTNVHWRMTNRLSLSTGYRVSWTDFEEGTARQSMLNLTMRLNVGKID